MPSLGFGGFLRRNTLKYYVLQISLVSGISCQRTSQPFPRLSYIFGHFIVCARISFTKTLRLEGSPATCAWALFRRERPFFVMDMRRALFILLAVVALLATATITAMNIVITYALDTWTSPLRIAATIGTALEATVFASIFAFCVIRARNWTFCASQKSGVWFALKVLTSVLATAASIVVLIKLSKMEDLPPKLLGAQPTEYLIGSTVALGCAFASQLLFFVIYQVTDRSWNPGKAFSVRGERRGSSEMRLKAIPYSKTAASPPRMSRPLSDDSQSRPGTSSGRSVTETMSSIRTSISQAVRPFSSRTRLLSTSTRHGRGAASLDSNSWRSRSSFAQDGFDSWDTSSVEPSGRQVTLDTFSAMPSRFLETIPASPTTSRSPSPGHPLDLEPPKNFHRTRSYSPVPKGQQLSPQSSLSELNIHPLFRTDSPTPPPQASPGTVVIAAPNAGRMISEKSLTRMRSGSLPNTPGPLSRQGSYDSFRKMTPSPNTEALAPPEEAEERKMTPPIPEWVLSAGSKSSLPEYTTRRLRGQPSTSTMPGGIQY